MKATTVLVTGAAGFIGSHVAECCLRHGMSVVATDDLSGGVLENLPVGCEHVIGDLRDPQFVSSLWKDRKFNFVYHLAAYAAEGLSHFIRRYNYQTNLVASVNLLNESVRNKVECFIFTSSIAVYGAGQTPMTEDTMPVPEDPYGISKLAFELDLKAAHRLFGLNYVIFRPHNVYGERQNIADRYRNVIGIFMNQTLKGEPMTVFGDGSQTRAFSYIDDVAPIIAKSPTVASARNEVFNVGADTPYTVLELASEVARALKKPLMLKHLPPREEVAHAFSDHAKTKKVFGENRAISLTEGISRMAGWVTQRGPAQPTVFSNIEISDKLPPSWRV